MDDLMGDTASLSAGGRPGCQDQPLKTSLFRDEWRKDWTGAQEEGCIRRARGLSKFQIRIAGSGGSDEAKRLT